jgi:hypothetical protein
LKDVKKLGASGLSINTLRTTTAVFLQMQAVAQTKKHFGETSQLLQLTAGSFSGALVAASIETPFIRKAYKKKLCPQSRLAFTIQNPTLFGLYWSREFFFTATVLTNPGIRFPKNYSKEELANFFLNLTKQAALFGTGAGVSASIHKVLVQNAIRDFPTNLGSVPRIEKDGLKLTLRKCAYNQFTHPAFKGPYPNPSQLSEKANNIFSILCGRTMFATRTIYLVFAKLAIDYSLCQAKAIHDTVNTELFRTFSSKKAAPAPHTNNNDQLSPKIRPSK